MGNAIYKDIGTRQFKQLESGEWAIANAIFSQDLDEHAKVFGKLFAIKRIGGFIKVTRLK